MVLVYGISVLYWDNYRTGTSIWMKFGKNIQFTLARLIRPSALASGATLIVKSEGGLQLKALQVNKVYQVTILVSIGVKLGLCRVKGLAYQWAGSGCLFNGLNTNLPPKR